MVKNKKRIFKFIDLFSWIWGFHIALKNVWWECVSACEIDKNARITYEYNFNNWKKDNLFNKWFFFNDITELSWNEFPEHDILCWGFPCQAFSIAWYRKGFEDWRWNLFFDVSRTIKNKQPKAIFLENVKNLKSHDDWKTFQTILDTLKHLWYHVKYEVLNTYEYWNLPQNRERIYIVWFREKEYYDKFSFPKKINLTKEIIHMLDKDVDKSFFYEWKPLYGKIKDDVNKENTAYQWRRQYVRENKKWVFPTLTANMWTWWHNVPIIYTKKWIRKLTPKECIRIQWFPENYKQPSISNWQLYKQAGNSVSVPVLERIWENIIKALGL
jgi:DNA (cytosine-5)-methyltransferase 1